MERIKQGVSVEMNGEGGGWIGESSDSGQTNVNPR